MRILWVSNAPFVASGYGNQTQLFTQMLKNAGHEVAVFGVYGHHGPTMNLNGVSVLPASRDAWGNDILQAHVEQLKPDVVVALLDIWVIRPENVGLLTAWAPVDHDPMPDRVKAPLLAAKHCWAMSRFAERQMRAIGLTPDYVPHGVDTGVYQPMDRAQARKVWGVDAGTSSGGKFLAVMVAANRGVPSRKSFERVLKAWAAFVKGEGTSPHPDALLYLHAQPESHDGIDLMKCAEFYGVPNDNLRLPDTYRLTRGDYGAERMNALYNAADVLLAPSMGEGFGIPVIEAQAAGCPAVVSDFTAQSELAGPGYKVPIYDDDRFYSWMESEYCLPRASEILKGMEWAYERRGDAALREASRAFAQEYDAKRVFETYLLPALERQVERERAQKNLQSERTAARLAVRGLAGEKPHVHGWAHTGLYIGGKLNAPCLHPGCAAALLEGQSIAEGVFPDEINGIRLALEDDPAGGVVKLVLREIVESYGLDQVDLKPGDVVLDVGAQVGAVSIYLAKRQPEAQIYAFEPVPENVNRLLRNLSANGVTNVTIVNEAVSCDGRDLVLHVDLQSNSGGSSAFSGNGGGRTITVPSTTLAAFVREMAIERIRLLKLDCEGAEYEIVESAGEVLSCVEAVRGEAHVNARLTAAGKSPDGLLALLRAQVPDVQMSVTRMAE